MNVLDTILYLIPGANVVVWENDINKIVWDSSQVTRCTKEQINAVNQQLVPSSGGGV